MALARTATALTSAIALVSDDIEMTLVVCPRTKKSTNLQLDLFPSVAGMRGAHGDGHGNAANLPKPGRLEH